jgi:hypothetical protein
MTGRVRFLVGSGVLTDKTLQYLSVYVFNALCCLRQAVAAQLTVCCALATEAFVKILHKP